MESPWTVSVDACPTDAPTPAQAAFEQAMRRWWTLVRQRETSAGAGQSPSDAMQAMESVCEAIQHPDVDLLRPVDYDPHRTNPAYAYVLWTCARPVIATPALDGLMALQWQALAARGTPKQAVEALATAGLAGHLDWMLMGVRAGVSLQPHTDPTQQMTVATVAVHHPHHPWAEPLWEALCAHPEWSAIEPLPHERTAHESLLHAVGHAMPVDAVMGLSEARRWVQRLRALGAQWECLQPHSGWTPLMSATKGYRHRVWLEAFLAEGAPLTAGRDPAKPSIVTVACQAEWPRPTRAPCVLEWPEPYAHHQHAKVSALVAAGGRLEEATLIAAVGSMHPEVVRTVLHAMAPLSVDLATRALGKWGETVLDRSIQPAAYAGVAQVFDQLVHAGASLEQATVSSPHGNRPAQRLVEAISQTAAPLRAWLEPILLAHRLHQAMLEPAAAGRAAKARL